MLEIGGGFDLLHEPLGPEDGSEFGPQDFDGHLPVVLQILGEVHSGHAAFANVAFDPIAVGESGRDAGSDLGHPAKMRGGGWFARFDEVGVYPSSNMD